MAVWQLGFFNFDMDNFNECKIQYLENVLIVLAYSPGWKWKFQIDECHLWLLIWFLIDSERVQMLLYTTGCTLQLCGGEAQQGEGTISKNCLFITLTFWRTLLTVMIMVSRNLDSHRFNKNYHRLVLLLGGWTGETQLFIVLSGNGNSRYNRWIQITAQKAENCGLQPQ